MSHWRELPDIWRASFEQAAIAYLQLGSAPIGAVIVDERREIVARGANNFEASRLAHAEMIALSAIPPGIDRSKCEIYSTVEPCLMCIGAIRLCQLRGAHFAALDPAAGSTAFLSANEFMCEFSCSVYSPITPVLEFVVVALISEFRTRTGHHRWRERWMRYHARGANFGGRLASSNAYRQWVNSSISAEHLYESLAASHEAA